MNLYNNIVYKYLLENKKKRQLVYSDKWGYSIIDTQKYELAISNEAKTSFWMIVVLIVVIIATLIMRWIR